MNAKTILLAVGGIGAGLLLARGVVQAGVKRGLITTNGDAERLAGIDHLYRASAAQQAATEAAQRTNRDILAAQLASSGQPDFYI